MQVANRFTVLNIPRVFRGDDGGGMMMTAIAMLMVMKGVMFVQVLAWAHACEWEHYVTGSAIDCCCCCCCRRGAVFNAVFSDEEGVWDLRPRNCRALEPVTAAAAAADAAALEGILENTLDAREEAYSFRSSAGTHVVLCNADRTLTSIHHKSHVTRHTSQDTLRVTRKFIQKRQRDETAHELIATSSQTIHQQ